MQGYNRALRKLRAVQRGGRQAAQPIGNSCSRYGSHRVAGASKHALCQKRSRRDSGRTAATEKTRLGDLSAIHAHGKSQHIATHGIGYLYSVRGIRQFTRVARLPKMVEDRCTKHFRNHFLRNFALLNMKRTAVQYGVLSVFAAQALKIPIPSSRSTPVIGIRRETCGRTISS